MNGSLNPSVLTRLLVLNGEVHDLERQLGSLSLLPHLGQSQFQGQFSVNPVADYQNEIDRTARTSLATCWLGESDSP
jgi:hypothetical protein